MRYGKRTIWLAALMAIVVASCAGADASEEGSTTSTPAPTTITTEAPATTTTHAETTDHGQSGDEVDMEAVTRANLGAAAFQDVEMAEAGGYVSTLDSLGCFENTDAGGMGIHYLNESLLDASLDPGQPEALVYELDADGEITGLVGHEYLVPLEAWTEETPPALFGIEFHEHPVLPFWILHAWIWKDNPSGMFNDWNPKVRMCPDGAPIFGVDLP